MSSLTRAARVGLIERKECWRLTFKGWLLLLLMSGGAVFTAFNMVFPFLAQNDPRRGDLLVVEGWIPDYSIEEVKAEFESGGYKLLVITGSAILKGEAFAEFKSFPEFTRAILLKKGWDESKVIAVPSGEPFKDRTYMSALALKRWMSDSKQRMSRINIYSMGAHSRRTRLLYQKAFEGQLEVGIIAGKDLRFDGPHWWRTSEGIRTIISETMGYLYARFLFSPPK
jgi:hypothetical protein